MVRSQVDLVLPCYNPPKGWAQNLILAIKNLHKLMPETDLTVYIVNDGSSQPPTVAELALLNEQITRFNYLSYAENRGKGYALRHGIALTQNPYCLFTDIDFPYEETSVMAVCHSLKNQSCDIAVGVRSAEYYKHVPSFRTIISKSLRFCTKHILQLPVSDTQCGIKGFNHKGKDVFLNTQTDRYLFDLEFLFRAARQPRLRVEPIDVQLKPGIIFSHMNAQVLINEVYNLMKIITRNSRRLNYKRRQKDI